MGGGETNGIYNDGSPLVVIDGANIFAYGGTLNNGVVNSSSNNVKIRRSTISGDTDGLSNLTSTNTMVSQSTVINGVSGGGYTCVASDDSLGHYLNVGTCSFP